MLYHYLETMTGYELARCAEFRDAERLRDALYEQNVYKEGELRILSFQWTVAR